MSRNLSKALVTLNLGQMYRDRWQRFCAANWQAYADRHGYNIICIDQPLDTSAKAQTRPVNWQKCLILEHEQVQHYDRVVWVDSDILINPNAPCIVAEVPEQKVGGVNMFGSAAPLTAQLTPQEKLVDRVAKYWGWSFATGQQMYQANGLPPDFGDLLQTGVMVFSAQHHRVILREIYNQRNAQLGAYDPGEMEEVSYALLQANLIHWIDYRFNRLWIECAARDYPFLLPKAEPEPLPLRAWKRFRRGHARYPDRKLARACVAAALLNNYFLHFAGTVEYMAWANLNIKDWQQLRGWF